ncbi:daptide-type RiPP biosynthesis methyltransferase [Streptomyces sp. NPDC057474]|uniref:daptide-type RiPP biosynthesis methyltransferase n=1 Tax=Streptomyces sp. NPDC057474 TaxID=3346144 RepID=UPI0036B0123A
MAGTITGELPGTAGELLRELAGRAELHDLYGDVGSAVYDDLCGGDTSEVREILHLLRGTKGPVLELAAGSGRLTLPMLAGGHEVVALDLSASMLGMLRDRLDAAPARLRDRCSTVHADMSRFALGRKFGAVVLGTTSISLLEQADRMRLYAAVAEHLAPGGRFLVTTVYLEPDEAAETETEFRFTGTSGRDYRLIEHWPSGAATRTVTVLSAEPGEGPVDVCVSAVQVLNADRLEAELRAAGLVVRARHVLLGEGLRYRDVLIEAEVA